jgi:hypothetical protein
LTSLFNPISERLESLAIYVSAGKLRVSPSTDHREMFGNLIPFECFHGVSGCVGPIVFGLAFAGSAPEERIAGAEIKISIHLF